MIPKTRIKVRAPLIFCVMSFALISYLSASTPSKRSGSSVPSRKSVIKLLEEKMLNEKNPLVVMSTSKGDITLEIYTDRAPKTARNFLDLAMGNKSFFDPKAKKNVKRPYFNGLIFHRVIPNFMIQGGDILGNGRGGPGYSFEDEISARALGLSSMKVRDSRFYIYDAQKLAMRNLKIISKTDLLKKKNQFNRTLAKIQDQSVEELLIQLGYRFNNKLQSVKMKKFTLAMANRGPNTNGSQFFVNLVDNPHLDGKHTVFGKLLKGRKTLFNIAGLPTDRNNKPKQDIVIKKVVLINE